MEADWEVEVGGDAPVIDAHSAGFVDLRSEPELAWRLAEAGMLPGLAEALIRLNGEVSPVWTAKCDVWTVEDFESFDLDELDALAESGAYGVACYIDLLPRDGERWGDAAAAVRDCKEICARLRGGSLRGCRVDLVVRETLAGSELGITAYLTACGGTEEEAKRVLGAAVGEFAGAVGDSTLE